jgi:positive regulator of sigma E activity
MAKRLERRWWRDYRRKLEKRFQQEEIVIRVLDCDTV